MKKIALSVVILFTLFFSTNLYAADYASQDQTPPAAPGPDGKVSAEPATTPAPTKVINVAAAVVPATPMVDAKIEGSKAPEKSSENLEFVSGEVSAIDEAAKTVTIKLYGETEKSQSDKVVSVKVDDSTDITDGEADRALKSLTAGTEVDVEYDPATNIATYIFVY